MIVTNGTFCNFPSTRLQSHQQHHAAPDVALTARSTLLRPNDFAAGKWISMEILVGVGLHAWCPVALKRFAALSINGNVQEKYLSSLSR